MPSTPAYQKPQLSHSVFLPHLFFKPAIQDQSSYVLCLLLTWIAEHRWKKSQPQADGILQIYGLNISMAFKYVVTFLLDSVFVSTYLIFQIFVPFLNPLSHPSFFLTKWYCIQILTYNFPPIQSENISTILLILVSFLPSSYIQKSKS